MKQFTPALRPSEKASRRRWHWNRALKDEELEGTDLSAWKYEEGIARRWKVKSERQIGAGMERGLNATFWS